MPKLTSLVLDDHRYTERLIAQLTADPAAVDRWRDKVTGRQA